jgi:hypothetical protein
MKLLYCLLLFGLQSVVVNAQLDIQSVPLCELKEGETLCEQKNQAAFLYGKGLAKYLIITKSDDQYYYRTGDKVFGPYNSIPALNFPQSLMSESGEFAIPRYSGDTILVNMNGQAMAPLRSVDHFQYFGKNKWLVYTTFDNKKVVEVNDKRIDDLDISSIIGRPKFDAFDGYIYKYDDIRSGSSFVNANGNVFGPYMFVGEYYIEDKNFAFHYTTGVDAHYVQYNDKEFGPYENVYAVVLNDIGKLVFNYTDKGKDYIYNNGKIRGPFEGAFFNSPRKNNFIYYYIPYDSLTAKDSTHTSMAFMKPAFLNTGGIDRGPYDKIKGIFQTDNGFNYAVTYIPSLKERREAILINGREFGPYSPGAIITDPYINENGKWIYSVYDSLSNSSLVFSNGKSLGVYENLLYLAVSEKGDPFMVYTDENGVYTVNIARKSYPMKEMSGPVVLTDKSFNHYLCFSAQDQNLAYIDGQKLDTPGIGYYFSEKYNAFLWFVQEDDQVVLKVFKCTDK